MQSIHALLAAQAAHSDTAGTPALGAPDRPDLSFGDLAALAGRTVAALNGQGIGCGDRVAIVLPNGRGNGGGVSCGGIGGFGGTAQSGLQEKTNSPFTSAT